MDSFDFYNAVNNALIGSAILLIVTGLFIIRIKKNLPKLKKKIKQSKKSETKGRWETLDKMTNILHNNVQLCTIIKFQVLSIFQPQEKISPRLLTMSF